MKVVVLPSTGKTAPNKFETTGTGSQGAAAPVGSSNVNLGESPSSGDNKPVELTMKIFKDGNIILDVKEQNKFTCKIGKVSETPGFTCSYKIPRGIIPDVNELYKVRFDILSIGDYGRWVTKTTETGAQIGILNRCNPPESNACEVTTEIQDGYTISFTGGRPS